jgi:trehalose/maltose hydrolase-like predicted phosphorylase
MLFYVFSSDELCELFARLGYDLDRASIPRNVEYYDSRSSHGSTLSRVVHAWVLARSDRNRAMKCFAEALQSDVADIQQGTTAEGIHLGAMASTVDLVQRVSTGIEVRREVLMFSPQLPEALGRLDMRVRYRGHTIDLKLTRNALTLRVRESDARPIDVQVKTAHRRIESGTTHRFELR